MRVTWGALYREHPSFDDQGRLVVSRAVEDISSMRCTQ